MTKPITLFIIFALSVLVACQSDSKDGATTEAKPEITEASLTDLADKMYNDSLGRIDFKVANEYMNAAAILAATATDNEKAAEFLAKAGETARSVRNFPKALEYYQMISDKYPNSAKAAQALFLRAFTLDNDLKRPAEARPLYETFLEKYPNDDFADDTQFLLENLGKTDDEIIESFNNK